MPRKISRKRVTKRAKEVGSQVEAHIEEKAEEEKIQYVANHDLFTIDTSGNSGAKQKIKTKDPSIWSKKFRPEKASKHEQKKISKLSGKSHEPIPKKESKSMVIWGAESTSSSDKDSLDNYVTNATFMNQKSNRHVVRSTDYIIPAVAVPKEGQSYNPEFEAHQDILGQAVAEELEREENRNKEREPISKGLSDETKKYINDNDDDGFLTDDWVDDDDSSTIFLNEKRKERRTRAQKNKKVRHRLNQLDESSERQSKKFLKTIDRAHEIANLLSKEEKINEKVRRMKELQKKEKLLQDPPVRISGKLQKLDRPTLVCLTDELPSSLRTLKPKGNPVVDRFDSFHKRNMIEVGKNVQPKQKKIKMIMT